MQPSGEQVICFIWLLSFAVEQEEDNTESKSQFQEMSVFDSYAQNTMLTRGIQKVSVKDTDSGHIYHTNRKYKDSAYFKAFEFYFLTGCYKLKGCGILGS